MLDLPMRYPSAITFALFLVLHAPTSSGQSVGPDMSREVTATYVTTSPVIDGDLSDAVWQSIEPIGDFVQRLPDPGVAPTERSEMRIAFDEDNLYFAFRFYDSEPDKIRANIFERGGRIDKDDNLWIMLDTYNDKRNAYLFEMNPLGTQDDAIITDEDLSLNDFNWDGIFHSEGNIDEQGWTLEIAIPFRTIRFSKDDAPKMGIAVLRRINRKNEQAIWPYISLDHSAGILQVSQYASLNGLQDLRRGRNIEIKPYLITGAQSVRESLSSTTESEFVRDAGVDIKYGISSNLTLDLTVNTDFAQVEADNVQINLDRFSLFFPEKREFFLERSGLFSFGDSRQTETFFSRRIGIDNDILAGARITGQAGPFSIGLLDIQTRKDKDLGLSASNNAVARVRATPLPRTTVGAIFTNLEQGDTFNRAGGVDATMRFLGNSEISGWLANVWDSDSSTNDAAGSASLSIRPSDLYRFSAFYRNVGTQFDPKLGFVGRRDLVEYRSIAQYRPRFGTENPFVRQLSITGLGSLINGQDGRKQSSEIFGDLRLSFVARDNASVSVERTFERLDSSFEIRDGAIIPAGDYNANRFFISGNTDRSRRTWVSARTSFGQFFNGNRSNYNVTVGYRYSKHFKFEVGANHNVIDLPITNGKFDATTASIVLQAAKNRKLFANALIQYDNFSKDVQANIRINWIHTPGSDLFLVFNTNYHVAGDDDRFDPRAAILNNRLGVAKLTYLIQL